MKRNRILNAINAYQGFAFGWLIPTLIAPILFLRVVGLIFVILLIINRFYQILLKNNCKEVNENEKKK